MGIEQGEGEKLSASQKVELSLKNYLIKDIPFGGAKYQAFFDYFDRFREGRRLISLREDLKIATRPEDIIDTSSKLRVAENTTCLIDAQIEQKNMSISGYYDAYVEISGRVAELWAKWKEGYKRKHPTFSKEDLDCQVSGDMEYVLVGIRADILLRNFKEKSQTYRNRSGGVAGG